MVVRDHEDGTCVTIGIVMPKHIARDVWEWTPNRKSTEGWSLKEPCRRSSVSSHRAGRREKRLRERKKDGTVG